MSLMKTNFEIYAYYKGDFNIELKMEGNCGIGVLGKYIKYLESLHNCCIVVSIESSVNCAWNANSVWHFLS